MKRKKFIKMLMWAGMSRNNAAECASLTQAARRSYFRVLGDLLTFHRDKFKMRYILDDMRVRSAIIHGTTSRTYKILHEGASIAGLTLGGGPGHD